MDVLFDTRVAVPKINSSSYYFLLHHAFAIIYLYGTFSARNLWRIGPRGRKLFKIKTLSSYVNVSIHFILFFPPPPPSDSLYLFG